MRLSNRVPFRSMTAGVLMAACVAGHVPHVSAATDKERAAARSIAKQGLDAFRAKQYDAAIDRFERAEALVHSPVHLLYLARAYAARGKLVKAHETYLKAKRETLTDASPAAFVKAVEEAGKELEALKPRLAKLTVQVIGAEGAAVSMSVDGEPVPAVLVGIEMPADPGQHRVEVSAPGYFPATREVELTEGEAKQLEVELLPDPNAAVSDPSSQGDAARDTVDPLADVVPTPRREEPSRGRSDGFLYASLGGLALGLGGGIYAYVNNRQRLDYMDEADVIYHGCPLVGVERECNNSDKSTITEKDTAAKQAGNRAVVGVVVGGVGLVAAGTLLGIWLGSDDEQPMFGGIQPWIGYRSAGISGTF